MTSRSKNAVRIYETEIDKSREEANWKKVVDLAQQLKARSPQHESLAHFLIGEGKLEAFLDEWPPTKENIERAQRELSEARGYLTLATDDAGKRAGVALDAHLLLGKLNYACGAYDVALKHYQLAELNTLTEKELPVRSVRIVAESYAIKGLCLEQNALPGSTSRYKQAEKESEMIRSFELASDLTLLYLQRAQAAGARAGPTLETALQRVPILHIRAGRLQNAIDSAGPTLETALQRVPILHIRAGRLQNAIDRYRSMLTAVESTSTQALRLTLTRQLAEVLMRGVTGQVYKAPEKLTVMPQQGTLTRRREDHVSEGPWKPKKYAGINQFVPRNEYEEVVLLLLVGEAMAVRDAVLSQSAEFEAARRHSLANAVAVADLLALAAARWGQLCLVLEVLFQKCRRVSQRAEFEAARRHSLANAVAVADLLALAAARWGQLCLVLEVLFQKCRRVSQRAEFEAARRHSLANAVAVADLLALAAARWGQLCLVLEVLFQKCRRVSQRAEFEAARRHSLANAVAVADLLALAAARWGQLCLVLEVLFQKCRRVSQRAEFEAARRHSLANAVAVADLLALAAAQV
ncbi:tetratricopeptide repeat protein 7B-like [Ostrinia nubilalis]|uniref:tetratricopeptide repeat protein 7B-like n=1 Tax=Ostrinia nubilalis TaxID=29057 RepID=UPI0030823E02